MTNTDESRRIVLEFCSHLANRDTAAMKMLVTDDAIWWMVGRPDRLPFAGAKPFDEMLVAFEQFVGQLETFTYTVTGVTAEGERVAVEAVAEGQLGDRRYNNTYLNQFVLKNGRISLMREFMDLTEVFAFMEA